MSIYARIETYFEVGRSNPALENSAVKRCCKAWKRGYRAGCEDRENITEASDQASAAFCAALPPLTTLQNCRDFIACVAYGIVIKAIVDKDGGKLIYAAQVALSSFVNEKKPQKTEDFAANQPKTAPNTAEK